MTTEHCVIFFSATSIVMERMESDQQDKKIILLDHKINTNSITVSFFAKAKAHQQKNRQSSHPKEPCFSLLNRHRQYSKYGRSRLQKGATLQLKWTHQGVELRSEILNNQRQ
jgi:hypothetical protein